VVLVCTLTATAWAIGELTQKPGADGCISQDGVGGCASGVGIKIPFGVTTSPDGKSVYVVSFGATSSAVASFTRNPDGMLDQPPGSAGCISEGGIGGCQPGIGLLGAFSVATSPDGKSVYVASVFSSAIAIFNRNPDGTLEQLPGTSGCISEVGLLIGCEPGIGLFDARALAVSPDGKSVYVASGDAIAIFNRNPDGTLDQLPGTAGCISQEVTPGCQPGTGLGHPAGVAVSPDGESVYVASGSGFVAIFSRNPDGTLEQLPGTSGCISHGVIPGCQPGAGLEASQSVTASPDGKSVYVASGSAIAIFKRNPDGTLVQPSGASGCIAPGGSEGCQPVIGLDGANSVATSPDGKSVYVTSSSGFVAIFNRSADGSLVQSPGTAGCISQGGSEGCQPGIGLDGARGVATSSDGRNVYVASDSGAVAIFDRAVPPPPADTLAPTISGFRLTPKRFNAAPKGRSSFRFRLSEAATVTIGVDRVRRGRKASKRFVQAGRPLRFQARPAGANKIAFKGKLSGRALKPGSYRATIRATDAAGNRSAPKFTRFTILTRRR
jgi:DNA-binding beta-propeller fold protein YncE